MTFVVTENCQKCKFTDCVEVCPVECFYELSDMLIIDPDECIDCGACVPECPVEAIYDESDLPEEFLHWIEFNADNMATATNITEQKDPLPTAEERRTALGF